MRNTIWLFFIIAATAATALFLSQNHATVSLYWQPYRIDVSLNLLLILTALVFVLLFVAINAVARLWRMPYQAKQWRAHQKERAMYHSLLHAMQHYMNGRHERALEQAETAIAQAQALLQEQASSSAASSYPSRFKPLYDTDGNVVSLAMATQAQAHWIAAECAWNLQDDETYERHNSLYQAIHTQLQTQQQSPSNHVN